MGYELVFHACFNCKWPFSKCGDSSVWIWLFYCAGFAFLALTLVPQLQTEAMMMKQLDKFYTTTLLKADSNFLKREAISSELFATLFSIGGSHI